MDWLDTEAFDRKDYYLAQIAASVERTFAKKGSRISIEKKLLKFTHRKQRLEPADAIQVSKNHWFAVTGVSRSKTKPQVRRKPPPVSRKGKKKKSRRGPPVHATGANKRRGAEE